MPGGRFRLANLLCWRRPHRRRTVTELETELQWEKGRRQCLEQRLDEETKRSQYLQDQLNKKVTELERISSKFQELEELSKKKEEERKEVKEKLMAFLKEIQVEPPATASCSGGTE